MGSLKAYCRLWGVIVLWPALTEKSRGKVQILFLNLQLAWGLRGWSVFAYLVKKEVCFLWPASGEVVELLGEEVHRVVSEATLRSKYSVCQKISGSQFPESYPFPAPNLPVCVDCWYWWLCLLTSCLSWKYHGLKAQTFPSFLCVSICAGFVTLKFYVWVFISFIQNFHLQFHLIQGHPLLLVFCSR